jgi:RimJ/RimL family protein N-acetyltransferase
MSITYYKRFRMEVDLEAPAAPRPALPQGLRWVGWREELLEAHADVKYRSFQDELDSLVFPCLGDPFGCRRLMREIRRKHGFLPSACWLIAAEEGYIAAIQGVTDYGPIGSIQNVGVVPSFRGLGLGRALVRQCLSGFAAAGLQRVYLEVTAENAAAVRLYRSVGFRKAKTLYKAVDG